MDLKSGGRAFLIIQISFSGMVEEDVLMWRVVTESVRPYAFLFPSTEHIEITSAHY